MARALLTNEARRQHMVSDQLRRRDIVDPHVLAAFGSLARERFVPDELSPHAYDDAPLPIGSGQTISQPYVVAITVQALQLHGHERVLEIGTGSGYAAAILGLVAHEVETIERIEELASAAADRLAELGFRNVHVHHGDGSLGWPERAPYEAIAVAAGAPKPPPALLDQLAIGGRMVLPHGDVDHQLLTRITRRGPHVFDEENLGEVRFVPLLGVEGWPVHG
ncbi:MAG TPA: protein-L-isoaspartate(D-aspartate) O-methyltransferase [Kofleriaceae bacterium]|nr:protein-L-isoaspartate(D-aspartate) O-methyltransferase [Kofleriaceae bacterium]